MSSSSTTVDFTANYAINVNCPIGQGVGGANLTKWGLGTLSLNAANTYSGTTRVNYGALQIKGPANGNNTILGNLIVQSTGSVDTYQNEQITNVSNLTIHGQLSLNNHTETVGSFSGSGSVFSGQLIVANGGDFSGSFIDFGVTSSLIARRA